MSIWRDKSMGCSESRVERIPETGRPSQPQAQQQREQSRDAKEAATGQAVIALLNTNGTRKLINVVRGGAIRFVQASYLRAGKLERMEQHQTLRVREIESGNKIFLSVDEAAAALEKHDRSVGVLTHGWEGPDHPDSSGLKLRKLIDYLRSPLVTRGHRFEFLFSRSFMSLPQNPRTPDEETHFQAGLGAMAYLYASATSTTVMRHKALPPTPANPRPYDARGWCCFESGVSTELLARLAFYPQLRALLHHLPPKLVEIDGTEPVPVLLEADKGGVKPRIERVEDSIKSATFTGKGDKEVVIRMFKEFVIAVSYAFVMGMPSRFSKHTYVGGRDADGQPDGEGVAWYDVGDVYTGEFRADRREGYGMMQYASGTIVDGGWQDDVVHGTLFCVYVTGLWYYQKHVATMCPMGEPSFSRYGNDDEWQCAMTSNEGSPSRFCDECVGPGALWRAESGEVDMGEWTVSLYDAAKQPKPVGEGARISADGKRAWRLLDGEVGEAITPKEARRLADGLSVPSPPTYEGERNRAGQREGQGTTTWPHSGVTFTGGWKADQKEGPGTWRWPSGNVQTVIYKANRVVGEGVLWSAKGTKAWKMLHGKPNVVDAAGRPGGDFSLEEARRLAEKLLVAK